MPHVGISYLRSQHQVSAKVVGSAYTMRMTDLSDRIRAARKAKGLTQMDVSKRFGIDRVSVTQWENGQTRPDQARLPMLADLLGVDVSWLMLGDGSGPAVSTQTSETFRPRILQGRQLVGDRDFPVYAAAKGGEGHMIVTFDAIEYVKRPSVLEGVPNSYGLLIYGDSMVPAFRPGSIALVHPGLPPARETDVILYDHPPFGEAGHPEAMIKRLLGITETTWKLEQYNPFKKFSADRVDWPVCHRVVGNYAGRG